MTLMSSIREFVDSVFVYKQFNDQMTSDLYGCTDFPIVRWRQELGSAGHSWVKKYDGSSDGSWTDLPSWVKLSSQGRVNCPKVVRYLYLNAMALSLHWLQCSLQLHSTHGVPGIQIQIQLLLIVYNQQGQDKVPSEVYTVTGPNLELGFPVLSRDQNSDLWKLVPPHLLGLESRDSVACLEWETRIPHTHSLLSHGQISLLI